MGHHIDDPLTHQRREADRPAGVVGKAQEGAAVGDQPAMQGDAVHGGRHSVLANAVVDVAAREGPRSDAPHPLRDRQVGMGEIGRAAHGQFGRTVDDGQRQFRRLAGRHIGRLVEMLPAEGLKRFHHGVGHIATDSVFEVVTSAGRREPLLPGKAGCPAALGRRAPRPDDVVWNLEWRMVPADVCPRGGDLDLAEGRAMGLFRAAQVGCALSDDCPAGDQCRPVGSPRLLDGFGHGLHVVAVHRKNLPAGGAEARRLVHRRR